MDGIDSGVLSVNDELVIKSFLKDMGYEVDFK